MKLVIGLGNPGREYKNTRHNIGFMVLDNYLGKVDWKIKMEAYCFQTDINNKQVLFIKPLTYMNLSGLAVSKIVNFYKIDIKDILVIQDDLDMSIGRVKIVYNSSSGGHNGIKDIERCLGTQKYARVKIGIANNKNMDTKDYVLGKFTLDEMQILNSDYEKLSDIVDDFCLHSLDRLMGKYNHK